MCWQTCKPDSSPSRSSKWDVGWDASSYHKRRMDGAVDGWDRHEERVAINLFPAIINLRMIHRARERAQEFLMVAAVESAHGHLSVIGHLLGSLPLSLGPGNSGTAHGGAKARSEKLPPPPCRKRKQPLRCGFLPLAAGQSAGQKQNGRNHKGCVNLDS